RALFAWLTRVARSRLHVLAATSSLPQPFPPGRFRTDRSVHSHLHPPRGFAPRTPLHALSLAASPARSDRVARSRALARVPTRSSLPQALPPGGFRTDCSVHSHLLTDVGDVPAGQRGQLLRLAGMALDERPPIVAGGAAGGASGVGMPQHVTSLEIAPIAGLLKDQVIRKVRIVVADVQPGEERVGGAVARVAVAPEDAEPAELVARQWIGGAGVAPSHVPGVLGEH